MSFVHPVIILFAVLSIVCSLFRLVSDIIGEVMVFVYSSLGLMIVLYVVFSVSLLFPQCVDVSAFRILMLSLPFLASVSMCLLYCNLGSNVSPRILGFFSVGSVVLFILSCSVVLYCAGSGVISVVVVLVGFSFRSFSCVHVCIPSRYGCTCV